MMMLEFPVDGVGMQYFSFNYLFIYLIKIRCIITKVIWTKMCSTGFGFTVHGFGFVDGLSLSRPARGEGVFVGLLNLHSSSGFLADGIYFAGGVTRKNCKIIC